MNRPIFTCENCSKPLSPAEADHKGVMANSSLCSVPDCGKFHRTKGFCDTHYRRWKKHGDPLKIIGTPQGDPERFYQDVVLAHEGDECLLWPYACGTIGYGIICRDGKRELVHRLICEDVNGPPPTPEHEAAHSCGKGHLACVTKSHLSWKTHVENEADKLIHGTHSRGDRNGHAKLTESEAREIMALKGEFPKRKVAAKYGISRSTVSQIQSGKRWAWLTTDRCARPASEGRAA